MDFTKIFGAIGGGGGIPGIPGIPGGGSIPNLGGGPSSASIAPVTITLSGSKGSSFANGEGTTASTGNNSLLYAVLAICGTALIGFGVWAFSRKKGKR